MRWLSSDMTDKKKIKCKDKLLREVIKEMKNTPKETKKETYSVWFTCPNCKMAYIKTFCKGIPAISYDKCPFCECYPPEPITSGCDGVQG